MIVNPKNLAMFLVSPIFISVLVDKTTNSTHCFFGINKTRLICLHLHLLAGQRRIVTKVDELLSLCDHLKVRINQAQTIQIHLADAIVEQSVV